MNEKLLHYIWRYQLFDRRGLKTTSCDAVEIISPGIYNMDAGADFQDARLKIGGTLWAGNVEIHITTEDWNTHKHKSDKAYNNVVLHVVYEDKGKGAKRESGTDVPTLQLKERIKPETLQRYAILEKSKLWVPCEGFIVGVQGLTFRNFLDRLLAERLQNKVTQVNEMLAQSGNDWENVAFGMVAAYLGAPLNKEPFLQLARSLPVKIWAKHQSDNLQIEALLFGQAGFLDEKCDDEYPNQLRREYNYLSRLHQLQPMEKHRWKFLRLRPSNFPTIRLAQLAALLCSEVKLFSRIIDAKNAKDIQAVFDITVSDYWKKHYRFDKPSARVSTKIGKATKDLLLINAVAPVLFAYGKYRDDETYCNKALQLLESCTAESNSIITGWNRVGVKVKNAADSQSLLQLKNEYCNKFRCLECAVGHKILK
ncbi:MAG TPA: DUF2851 family protein [Chitinophagales bacterium]|nr:DUF2851 family protein [Chitinophagales bacterium]